MTVAVARELAQRKKAGRSKYRAVRTQVDGITFASKREALAYAGLRIAERLGSIQDLRLQPAFDLVVNGHKVCRYVGDFEYVICATGEVIVADVKGRRLPLFSLKAKLFRALMGYEIQEVK